MKMNSWNPWHGCNKYSEGCDHCYMYYLDAQRDQDGSLIYKTKTNFNLPLKKTRQGIYKIISIQYFLNPISTGLAGHPLDLNDYFFILLHQNLPLQLFQLIVQY